MGKGKGIPEYWVAVVKPGRVMFEMAGVDLAIAKEAMELASHKLPIRTKFVSRAEGALMAKQQVEKSSRSGYARTRSANEGIGRADFPSPLSVDDRTVGSAHQASFITQADGAH